MGMNVPYSTDEINKATIEIVNIQKTQNGYIRPIIWRGSEMMAISAQKNKINVAIARTDASLDRTSALARHFLCVRIPY